MPLGAKVGLDPGRIVTWGPSSYLPKGAQHPNFRPTSIVAKRPPISATAEHLLFQPASKVKVGVPQSTGSISAASGPKFTILWEHVEEILLLKIFFPIVDTCLSCEDIARQSCGMVPRWRLFGDFLCAVFSARSAAHFRPAF